MEHVKKSLILTVVISSMLFIHPVYAVPESVAQADVRLQQVALFKNGLAFFVSEVTCPNKKDSFSFVPAAAASHGTFWVAYPPKVKLESLVAKQIEHQQQLEAVNISELLKANVGNKVRLWFSDREDSAVEGAIKYFAEDRELPVPNPYAPGAGPTTTNYRGSSITGARLTILETDAGEVCVDPQSVRRIEFPDGKANKTFAGKSKSMQLDVKIGAPAGGKKLTVSYLAKGITWAPSYIVDITKGDEAKVSAKATIINEACDLDDVTVQLVTGFPHLQFADVVSPLTLKENLAQFLQSLLRGESQQRSASVMSNVMRQRAAREEMSMMASPMPEYGAAMAGKAAEDLFFYPVEKVHLARQEVGYFPLFTESVPYKHIYQWRIPDYVNEEDYYSQRRRREQDSEPDEEVWHCLRMQNCGKVPWTTAPAQILKEGLILGQDTLNYTPVQGETTLRITQAVSVKAEQTELEIDRKRDAAQLYGYHYDLVTVEGKLSVINFQQKAITLEIAKTFSGELKSSQPEAKVEKQARGLRRMNGVIKLTWTIELEQGQQKQISYIYDVYVRR